MDRRVVNYIIAYGLETTGLNREVRSRLQNGWELYGNPYALLGETAVHFQAMVKYEERSVTGSHNVIGARNIVQSVISSN